jgi:hypothetical protein
MGEKKVFGRLEMKESGITKVYIISDFNNSALVAYFGREKSQGSIHPMSLKKANQKYQEKLANGYQLVSATSFLLEDEIRDYFPNNDKFLKYLNIVAVSPLQKNLPKKLKKTKAKKNTQDYYDLLENF